MAAAAPELMMWSSSLLTMSLICPCGIPGRSLAIFSCSSASLALLNLSVSASSVRISASTPAFFRCRS